MLYILQFLLFLVYTILIFCVKTYYWIVAIVFINILLMIIARVNIKKMLISILKLMPFIIFTTIINIIISGVSYGVLIGIRLILVCNVTYIYTRKMTSQRLQYVIETLLKPLKIFNIDSREIGIMICIAIAFIPIIQREMEELKYSLKAKGFDMNFKNMFMKPNYILIPLMTSIVKKIGEIEQCLLAKGYVSE